MLSLNGERNGSAVATGFGGEHYFDFSALIAAPFLLITLFRMRFLGKGGTEGKQDTLQPKGMVQYRCGHGLFSPPVRFVLVQREMEFCLLQISYFGACLSDIV